MSGLELRLSKLWVHGGGVVRMGNVLKMFLTVEGLLVTKLQQ